MKKYIFFFLFSFINFFFVYDVTCTKEVTSTNDDPLTPLNRFDKYYLRMFKKVPRLQQNGSNIINYSFYNFFFFFFFFYILTSWHSSELFTSFNFVVVLQPDIFFFLIVLYVQS
ncbi:hypothetical protein PFFVO_04328 [Plasmodium falciparum Vietnam Oak-Knoll (FVO)]|uniref:Uncharacterized protein n=1 Tax=Plasmodium falciparum Vietnam Oak-Knoll (FVO) TaxID=1036723 RepID=A0A024V1H2_PLAFA|nr:hypothetical protein PFFVO_04328 [Plasmodium falciparum Vietnam Oak-Knoll (FVO)]